MIPLSVITSHTETKVTKVKDVEHLAICIVYILIFFFSKIVQLYLVFRDDPFSELKFNKPEITFYKTNILTTKL